eukprot:scaffold256162_cov48-Prasinocladus_malaysianus.AAC.2
MLIVFVGGCSEVIGDEGGAVDVCGGPSAAEADVEAPVATEGRHALLAPVPDGHRDGRHVLRQLGGVAAVNLPVPAQRAGQEIQQGVELVCQGPAACRHQPKRRPPVALDRLRLGL